MRLSVLSLLIRPGYGPLCLAAVASLCLARPAMAVNETFAYPDGPLEGRGVAGQWTGPWAVGTESAPPIGTDPWQVQSQRVVIEPVNPTVPFGFTESDVQRNLTTPVTGSSVYLSFLITPGDMGAVFDPLLFANGSTGAVIGFADSQANIGTNGPMITTFRFYEGFSGLFTDGFAISLNGVFSTSNTIIGSWTQDQTYRLVGRLSFDAQGSQERWSVWIDPVAESDPAAGSVTKNLAYSQIGMTRLYQYVDNFAAVGSSMIDDLRIGATWDSVTAPIPPALEGDLDGDGFVGITDLNIVLGNWNQTVPPGNPLADPSGDGFVGIEDLNNVLGNWNAGAPPTGEASANVPEPGAALLLLLAGAGVSLLGRSGGQRSGASASIRPPSRRRAVGSTS